MEGTAESLKRLLVALLVGLLIGLDRERAEVRKKRPQFAGVRTFALIAIIGGGLALLVVETGPWLLIAGLLALSSIAVVSYRYGIAHGDVGATTEIAALATYVIGALAGIGHLAVAAATGVSVAVLLVAKPRLEKLSRALSEQEVVAVLELAVITAVVMPILPDRGFGPWQALNPYRIWMVVVLVSVVSFVGFVVVRWKGERAGPFWAAGLGALVSSTATTLSLARRSREAPPGQQRALAAAAVLASTVMCARIAVLVAASGRALLPRLAIPLATIAIAGTLATLILARSRRDDQGEDKLPSQAAGGETLGNPLSLGAALLFGALFAVILLAVRASEAWFGARGMVAAAALSGLVDLDAVSVAVARGARSGALDQAQAAIVAAYASNNLFKSGIAIVVGAGRFRRDVALGLGALAVAGGAAAALVFLRVI